MDKQNHKCYKILLSAQFLRSVSSFAFWICAYISILKQGFPDSAIVPCFLLLPIVGLATDLPTGVYADRVSCRAALLFSGLCDLLAFTSLILVSVHLIFAPLALALKALGFSFESGAGNQLLFREATLIYGQDEGSKKSSIHSEFTNRLGSLVGGGGGALIVNYWPRSPWVLAIFFTIIGMFLLTWIKSPLHLSRKYSSITLAYKEIVKSLGLAFTLMFAPVFIFRFADGFRTGTEGVLFVPYMNTLLGNGGILALLPILATCIRMPVVYLAWKSRIPIPRNAAIASSAIFLTIGILIAFIGWTTHPYLAVFAAAVNFGLYSVRDMWSRHWENQAILAIGQNEVTFRSAFSTTATASQLLGTAVLTIMTSFKIHAASGLILAGLTIVVSMGAGITLLRITAPLPTKPE